jgi:hypothetical protein
MKEYLNAFTNKKFLAVTLVSVVLVVALVTQVTMALFFSSSNASSTIIISDLNITAQFVGQPGGNLNITTADLIPGERIARTLEISNGATSEEAYVRIQSNFIIDANEDGTYSELEESLAVQMQLAAGQTGWVQGAEGPQFWFYYNGVLPANQTITVNVEFVVFPTESNFDYAIGNDEAGKPFELKTKVNAVQTANNGTSYADANWPEV